MIAPKLRIYSAAAEILRDWGYQSDVREDFTKSTIWGGHIDIELAIVTYAPGPMVGAAIVLATQDAGEDASPNPARYVPGSQEPWVAGAAAYY